VVEIRQADLQFTAEETADFMQRVAQTELAPDDVAALQQRTEGWIAGLQLLALSLRGHDDVKRLVESFTGSHRYVLDYLVDEVFQRQPADVQDFLLKTSILDRFTSSLCDAIAERDDSRQVLVALEQANLFIVPLDQLREWYRYHHLFADLLHHRLQVESRYDVAQLHQRASQWYAENGLPADAIQHALAACDWERAADLIVSAGADMLKRGEVVTLLGWYQALPEDFVRARPQICCEYCWPLLLAQQIDAAEFYLEQAEQAAHGAPVFLGKIAAAQAYVARIRGDGRRAAELSQRALSLLPRDDWAARGVVAMNLGMAYWYAGHLVEADQVLTEAREAAHRSGNSYAEATAQVFLCKIEAARGKLHRAADAYRQVIEGGGQLPIVALAQADLARLLYEWNDLEAAADQAQQAIELSQRTSNVEFQIAGFRTLALVKQAQGDAPAAQAALLADSRLVQHPGISLSARWHALAYHVLIALAGNNLDMASQLVEQFPALEKVETLPDYVLLSLAQARWLLMQGRRVVSAELLGARYERVSRAGLQTAIVETRTLQALAVSAPEASLAFLTEALSLAQPEGMIRTFADLGEPLAPILREAALRGTVPKYVGQILAAIKGRQKEVASSPSSLVEPLSERELAVLRLVAAGLSNREIAEKLIISPGTAKSHINHICGKLGVRNRTHAVTRAKELGLV
jgi:LuxR family maltose regulon positive regulatory protein